jgi:hypothetical protein
VWECVQHTARVLRAEDGVAEPAARLVAAMGARAEDARALAYRLYEIASQKGWAAEALVYNVPRRLVFELRPILREFAPRRRPGRSPWRHAADGAPAARGLQCARGRSRAGQQLRAFAGPLFGQQRVLANHQAFARIVGACDLGHVAVLSGHSLDARPRVAIIKQRGLQRPARARELLDRRRPQCGDPIQTSRAQRVLDARAGQQSAVPTDQVRGLKAHDHHHALPVETLLQLVDLRRQRHRIGGIAFKHLDRYRAAVGRTHQADDDLPPVATVVAAVALLRQFAAAPFEIGGGDVVEQQRAIPSDGGGPAWT